jgi:broad specificity polyphosphatase/5'/3'-nucleotidase SurE
VVANLNVPNLTVNDMAGWRHTTIGRVPPRVVSEATLEPKVGHPGTFRVAMRWGDAVSLPDGTDGGAVERNLVSVTLLSSLVDARTAGCGTADQAAEAAIGHALDALFGKE